MRKHISSVFTLCILVLSTATSSALADNEGKVASETMQSVSELLSFDTGSVKQQTDNRRSFFVDEKSFNNFAKAINEAGYESSLDNLNSSMKTTPGNLQSVTQDGQTWTVVFDAETKLSGKVNLTTCGEFKADVALVDDQIKIKRVIQSIERCDI